MLTPLDIQNAVFHRSFRGYNEAEVDDFLDRVVAEYEQLYRENLALKAQLAGREEASVAAPAPAEPWGAGEAGGLPEELERLRQAVREETKRLETLRHQRRLFAAQFQAMLESYRTLLAEEGVAGSGSRGGEQPS